MPATRRSHPEKSIGKRAKGLVIALTAMILGGSALRPQQIMAQVQKNGGTSNTVKGTGTTNFVPVWTSSSTISNSILSQSGTNLNVGGNLSAVNFGGNGSGLSNVNALTLGGLSPNAFAQLGAGSNVFTGAVSASSFSGNGSGVSNVNASTLGGLGPSGFAQLGVSNIFNADQTINGQLNLGGSVNNAMVLQGNQTDPSGNESANVIGGFGGDGQFPGNSVTSGVVGATIAGGGGTASGKAAQNKVTADWGAIGGGASNVASGSATVAGGYQNSASGSAASIGGGSQNTAGGGNATVSGGGNNTASGLLSTVGGGANNTANGTEATVPGGLFNSASGDHSFAAGSFAIATQEGSFVWGDHSTAGVGVSDTAPNQFVARSAGGVTFYTSSDLTAGATLAPGSGSWSSLSDRNVKANFMLVDGESILKRLAALPILTWNYKAQPESVRHIGPTAQDFREAFGLGEDERHISTVDAQGIALAAVQELYREVSQKDAEIANLRKQIEGFKQLKDRLAGLETRLAAIESSR